MKTFHDLAALFVLAFDTDFSIKDSCTHIPQELQNKECHEALKSLKKSGPVAIEMVEYPMETGALLWNNFVEVPEGKVILTTRGEQALLIDWPYTR
jgi:hypothetical protein